MERIIVSVDLGFGFVKVVSEFGVKTQFPSIVKTRTGHNFGSFTAAAKDDYGITYTDVSDGVDPVEVKYHVGSAALTNNGKRRIDDKEILNIDEMKILIATAIAAVNPNNYPVVLCVGLPLSHFSQKREELKDALKGYKAKVNIGKSGTGTHVEVTKTFIFPQAAGAYYAAIYDLDGAVKDYELAGSSVAVVDPGYRTVDVLVMAKGEKGINFIEDLSFSLEEDGMYKAFTQIAKIASETKKREISVSHIEKAILWHGSKLEYRGEEFLLTEIEDRVYQEHAEVIMSSLRHRWGSESDFFAKILIAGGGGNVLYPFFAKKFEQAHLMEECSFANAVGFLCAYKASEKMRAK